MKTINVWTSTFPIDDSGALVVHPTRPPGANYFPATLIQWDGPPQRVFSEEDVKQIVALACSIARMRELGDMGDGSPVDVRIAKAINAKYNTAL